MNELVSYVGLCQAGGALDIRFRLKEDEPDMSLRSRLMDISKKNPQHVLSAVIAPIQQSGKGKIKQIVKRDYPGSAL